jgi:hypothetical protein
LLLILLNATDVGVMMSDEAKGFTVRHFEAINGPNKRVKPARKQARL